MTRAQRSLAPSDASLHLSAFRRADPSVPYHIAMQWWYCKILRRQVFEQELQWPLEVVWDAADDSAWHIVGLGVHCRDRDLIVRT